MEKLSEEQEQRFANLKKELDDLREITFDKDDDDQTKIIYLLHEIAKQLIYLNDKVNDMDSTILDAINES